MAIGDLVGTLVAVGGTATSFVLTNNPGGFFAISGSNLIEAVNTPDGIYPITIKAIGPGYQATTSFSLDFTGGQPIPPPGVFSLGVNISGAQNSFPSFPTPDAINYFVGKGFQKIRFPICWSITNSQGQTVGIQTAALGPLNPDYYTQIDAVLSTVAGAGAKCLLDLHNFGFGPSANVMPQSDAMTVAPWFKTAIGVAQPTTTANAAINPFGTMTATQVVLPAVTTAGTQSALAIPIVLTTVNTMEWSVFLMGAVGGESLYIMTTPDGVNYSRVRCTLTTSWQRFSFTGTSAAGVSNFFEIGADLRDSGQTAIAAQTIYASCGQLEFGSSATAYSAQGSYAVGSTQLPVSSFADLWAKLSARYKGNPGLYGYDIMNEPINGFNSTDWFNACQAAINAIRANGDTTTIYIEGVNFSGGWNWVSGEGNAFNNANFYLLVDPANNLIFSAHGYFDHDASGTNFSYSIETSVPGVAPPGEMVGPTIGVDRALREFIPWCSQHGLRPHWGEYATSSDFLALGGNDNYQAWNLILKNFLDTCVAENIECTVWGGGFDPNYGFNLSPSNTLNNDTLDFTSAGLQSTQMVVLEQYTGYTGPQPIAYRIDLPVVVTPTANPEQPIVTINPYSTVGSPSGNFTIRYNGLIPSGGAQITPYAHFTDDTAAGGIFTPPVITLPPGQNAIAYFTYTPSVAATLKIGATNSAGWIDPPILGFSSIVDDFVGLPTGSADIVFDVRRRYTPYLGTWATLQRQSDLQTMTFGFDALGNLPRQAIQDWAGSRIINTVSVNNQIAPAGTSSPVVFSTVYHGNNTYNAPLPIFNLVNSAGYPEIQMTGNLGEFNFVSNGLTQMSVNGRLSDANNGAFIVRQDWFTGPFAFKGASFSIFGAGTGVPTNQSVNCNIEANVYHTYAGTVASNTTNGMVGYRDGSAIQTINSETFQFVTDHASSGTEFGFFKFGGPTLSAWVGRWTSMIMGSAAWTPTQIAMFASDDAAYYSTPLPDSLSAVNPEVFGAAPVNVSVSVSPFASVTIRDTNSGSPTDSVTITLTGTAGGSLSGAGISGSGPYTIAAASAASITTTLRGAVYTTAGSPAQTETLTILVTSSAGSSITNSQTVITTVPASNPVIAGALATNVVTTSLPFWNIVITDPNSGATDSVTIALSGPAGGALAGSGITGTGPYAISSGTPAGVTAILQAARYTPAGSIGQSVTATIGVTSSAGTSASDNHSVVTIIDVAPAETPYAAPGGTFTPIGNLSGVNLSGAETSYPSSNQFNYAWPSAQSLTYWAGKGFGIIRMPFWHRRMQQLSYGQLDPPASVFTYPGVGSLVGRSDEPAQIYYGAVTAGEQTNLNAIKQIVDQAHSLGMYVIFDMHNFGFMTDTYSPVLVPVPNVSNSLGTSFEIGVGTPGGAAQGVEATAQFVDLWTRIATKFKNYPNVIWGLMNEPFAQTAAQWQAAAVQGINAIAAVTTAQTVLIPGTSFTGAHSWTSSGNAAAWAGYTPPAGLPVMFEMHEYLDSDFSGTHNVCVFGSAPMVNATTWATANGFKIFIGEIGWTQDTTCPPLATQLLNYMVANPTVYAGYTYWIGGNEMFYGPWNLPGANALSAVPAGYPTGPFTDAPQTTLMLSNII